MSLAASIAKYNSPQGIDAILIALPAEDCKALRDALNDKRVGPTAISRALREHNHDVSEASVRRWRERNSVVDGL